HHGVAGAHDGGVGDEEEHRLLGDLAAHLGGVVGVVAPHRDDLAPGDHRRQQPDVLDQVGLPGELDLGVQRVARDGRDLLAGPVDQTELGVLTGGESANAHGTTIRRSYPGRWWRPGSSCCRSWSGVPGRRPTPGPWTSSPGPAWSGAAAACGTPWRTSSSSTTGTGPG